MDPFENQLSSFGGGGHDPFASHAQHMQHVQQMQQQQGGGHDPFASHARHMQQVQQMHQQQSGNHARHMQQVQQMQQQMMGGMMGGMGGMNMPQQMQQMQQQMMGGMNDGFGGHMLGGTSRCGWFPLVSTCCKKKGSHLNLTRVCSFFVACVLFFFGLRGWWQQRWHVHLLFFVVQFFHGCRWKNSKFSITTHIVQRGRASSFGIQTSVLQQ